MNIEEIKREIKEKELKEQKLIEESHKEENNGQIVQDTGNGLTIIKKGDLVVLNNEDKCVLHLYWEADNDMDLDSSVLLLNNNNTVDYIVYYQKTEYKEAVKHYGDNLTGGHEGIEIFLNKLPENISSLIFVVNIYLAGKKKLRFSDLNKAYIELFDDKNNVIHCEEDLSKNLIGNNNNYGRYEFTNNSEASNYSGLILGKFIKNNNNWEFIADYRLVDADTPGEFKNFVN